MCVCARARVRPCCRGDGSSGRWATTTSLRALPPSRGSSGTRACSGSFVLPLCSARPLSWACLRSAATTTGAPSPAGRRTGPAYLGAWQAGRWRRGVGGHGACASLSAPCRARLPHTLQQCLDSAAWEALAPVHAGRETATTPSLGGVLAQLLVSGAANDGLYVFAGVHRLSRHGPGYGAH